MVADGAAPDITVLLDFAAMTVLFALIGADSGAETVLGVVSSDRTLRFAVALWLRTKLYLPC